MEYYRTPLLTMLHPRSFSVSLKSGPVPLIVVKDASLTQTYSFLPASWAGDTHEETDFLPIGDREEKGINRRTDSLVAIPVLMAKYLQTVVKESEQED